jgi:hypothetical protein
VPATHTRHVRRSASGACSLPPATASRAVLAPDGGLSKFEMLVALRAMVCGQYGLDEGVLSLPVVVRCKYVARLRELKLHRTRSLCRFQVIQDMEARSRTASPAMSTAADGETMEGMVLSMLREKGLAQNVNPDQVGAPNTAHPALPHPLTQHSTAQHSTHTHTHTHTNSHSHSRTRTHNHHLAHTNRLIVQQ